MKLFHAMTMICLPAIALFAGCSNNKPGDDDIQAALAPFYECPAFELRDVKKLNGEPGANGTYEVAIAYTVAIKGGEPGAVKLLTDWVHLTQEDRAIAEAQAAVEHEFGKDDARLAALKAYGEQTNDKLNKLIPCDGKELAAVVGPLYQQAEPVLRPGSGSAALPAGVQIVRPGVMSRSENGWRFRHLAPGFNSFDFLETRPVVFSLPKSQVPDILAAKTATAVERTLTGVFRKGQTDSCVAVTQAGGEKCYGLPADAARIFSVCGDGDSCAITGHWDDKTENLTALSRVEKVAP